MRKIDVQQRVLSNGKPLGLDLFTWDEDTNTFSSIENKLMIDFSGKNGYTINTGSRCTINTGSRCTINTGSRCTINTDTRCIINTGDYCTINTDTRCILIVGSNCILRTRANCVFKTGYRCTFDTNEGCVFDTGPDCVIIRSDMLEVILPIKNEIIRLNPYMIKGYISSLDGKNFYLNGDYNGSEYVIINNILSEVISRKGSVIKVKNYNDVNISYIVEQNGVYAHGKTMKEAKESIIYKSSNRDTSIYKDLTLDSILTKDEAIKMYICITGACAFGTKQFVDTIKDIKDSYTIKELVELTTEQYKNETFKQFFIKNKA